MTALGGFVNTEKMPKAANGAGRYGKGLRRIFPGMRSCLRVRSLIIAKRAHSIDMSSSATPAHVREPRTPPGVSLALWSVPMMYGVLALLLCIPVLFALGRENAAKEIPGQIVAWQFLIMIFAAILVGAFLLQYIRLRIVWEAMLTGTLFLGVWVYAWFVLPLPFALLCAALFTILQAYVRRVFVHDVFLLIGAAGISLNFALLFHPYTLLIVLVTLVIYDMFAGRPGGFAAELSAAFFHRGLVPGLLIPGQTEDFIQEIPQAMRNAKAVFLGAGDVILPGIFLAQAMIRGWVQALFVLAGIGIGAVFLGRRGATKPYPALLLVGLGAGIPYAIMLIFQLL